MSDVLSQDEIDKLLKAVSSGEIDAEEFKANGSNAQIQFPVFSNVLWKI